jgi:hypothetical protein
VAGLEEGRIAGRGTAYREGDPLRAGNGTVLEELAVSTPPVYSFHKISQVLEGKQNFLKLNVFLKKQKKRGV